MSQSDADENVLSDREPKGDEKRLGTETIAGQGDSENVRLVPVAESIRYRKRAQSAEKKVETLAQALTQAKQEASEMAEQLKRIKAERELVRKLATEGAVDLEAALLIAKARIEGEPEADLNGVIEQLKKEKQYLFAEGNSDRVAMTAQRTAVAKDRMTNRQTILERAAKKAATTGNRTDLQEYLKLRRNFV